MEIKGLYEALGISQTEVDELRDLKMASAAQRIMFYSQIVATGGTIHKVDHKVRAKNRKANKAARKARHHARNG